MATTYGMRIRASLVALHRSATTVFEQSHAANDEASQQDADLRELVAQMSAALTALDRASAAAARAFKPEADNANGCFTCAQLRDLFSVGSPLHSPTAAGVR